MYRSDFWERLSSQNGSDGVGHPLSPAAWFNVENGELPFRELVQWIEDHKAKLCLAIRDLLGERWLNYLDNKEALFMRKIALGEAYLERADCKWKT